MNKVITVAQQKGGAGKSTIASHLAVAISEKNKKVALIDIDPQGSITRWHFIRQETLGQDNLIDLVACSGIRISSQVNSLKNNYDFIIIDSPPHTDSDAKSAIRVADFVLIPMQPSPTDLWATNKTFDYALLEKKLAKIVLNRFNNNLKLSKSLELEEEYILESTIGNRVGFASSMFLGKTILETQKSSAGALEIRAMRDEILKELSK